MIIVLKGARVKDQAVMDVEREILLGVRASGPQERGPVEEAVGARAGDLVVREVYAHLAFAHIKRRPSKKRCGELLDDVANEKRLGHRPEASAGANKCGGDNNH